MSDHDDTKAALELCDARLREARQLLSDVRRALCVDEDRYGVTSLGSLPAVAMQIRAERDRLRYERDLMRPQIHEMEGLRDHLDQAIARMREATKAVEDAR